MILRKDIILLSTLLIWAAYVFWGLELMSHNAHEIIVNFTASLGIVTAIILVLMILGSTIKKFGAWLESPLFKKKS